MLYIKGLGIIMKFDFLVVNLEVRRLGYNVFKVE